MTVQRKPRFERAKLVVPHGRGMISFDPNPVGPDIYQFARESILGKGQLVPTGEEIASLLYAVYCNNDFRNEPEVRRIREIMSKKHIWVFNENIWTSGGVFVVPDLEARGLDKLSSREVLEQMLKNGKEINGVGFIADGKVRFAPKNSYRDGRQYSHGDLSKSGFVVASYGVKGAEKLVEVSSRLRLRPTTSIVGSPNPLQGFISTDSYIKGNYKEGLDISGWGSFGGGFAFGLLRSKGGN
jgi:hypothetical protein